MADAKHTPGPWSIGRGADGCPLIFVPVPASEGSGHGIAHVNRLPRMGIVRGDMDANANLLAAAPDLLEVCQLFQHYAKGNQHPEDEDTWAWFCHALVEKLNAAVAKAEGRSND